MEWLRHVDLSEYAPNLRGSGVHGALLVHEKRFTAEILAGILSIPPAKTLLRRHLSLHIKVTVYTKGFNVNCPLLGCFAFAVGDNGWKFGSDSASLLACITSGPRRS